MVAEEVKAANAELKVKQTAFAAEIAALDKHGKDYDNKLKAIQNKEAQMVKAHENHSHANQGQGGGRAQPEDSHGGDTLQ